MTLPINDRITNIYTTNGSLTEFEFDFRVFFDVDNGSYGLEVRKIIEGGYEVLSSSLYTVVPNSGLVSGKVVFAVAPADGQQIYIAGKTPTVQQLNLTNYGRYNAEAIETNFDLHMAVIQEWLTSLSIETAERKENDLLVNANTAALYAQWQVWAEENVPDFAATYLDSQIYDFRQQWIEAMNSISTGIIPALAVSTATGQNQQEINDFGGAKWWDKPLGYSLGATVKLENGDIVKSTIPNNTINPNVDMTGWEPTKDTDVIKTVESIADLIAIQNPKDGQVVYVNNSLLKFNPLTIGLNNTGTLFNGWERQYYQDVWLEWFGLVEGGNIADVLLKALPLAKLQHINFKCKKGTYVINKQVKVSDIQGFSLDCNGSKIDVQYNSSGYPYNQFLYIDGIVDRTASLTFTNSATLKNVRFDGSSTDQNPVTSDDSQLINGITIAGFKTINLYNFEAKNWAGQCTKFLVTNNINVENVLIENVGYASERDATGDAFYIGERDGICFANFKNVVANGKEIFGSNSRIGITVENLNTALRQDAGCIITVEDSSFKHYNRFVHIESLLSGVKIFVKNSTIGADVVYFSLDLPLDVYSENNTYSFYNKSYAGTQGMTRDTVRFLSVNDTIDASKTATVLGFDSVGSTYINATINNPVAILASNLLRSKMIDCTFNIDREVGSLTYASEIPMYGGTWNATGTGAYSIWDTMSMYDVILNNVKSGSPDRIHECEFYFDTSRAGYEANYGSNLDAKVYHDNVIAYQPVRYAIKKATGLTPSSTTAQIVAALQAANLAT